jgi:hypothetical protein
MPVLGYGGLISLEDAMDHVYMTQCSLIRAYHQMETAKRSAVAAGAPEWMRRLTASLSRHLHLNLS